MLIIIKNMADGTNAELRNHAVSPSAPTTTALALLVLVHDMDSKVMTGCSRNVTQYKWTYVGVVQYIIMYNSLATKPKINMLRRLCNVCQGAVK